MIPLINNLLLTGYAADEILNFISKKFKGIEKGIENSRSQGYDDENILKFLSGKIPVNKNKAERQLTQNERYLKAIGLKTKSEKEEQTGKFIKGAFSMAGSALGAYALYRALPQTAKAIMPTEILPAQKSPLMPKQSNQIGQQTPPLQIGQSIEPVPPTPPPSPQTPTIQPNPQTPIAPVIPNTEKVISSAKDIFTKHGFNHQLDSMIKKGTGADLITAFFNKNAPNKIAVVEKESGRPFRELVDEYVSQPQNEKQKKSFAALPSGQIGEIEEVKNGIAKINVDGQIKSRKLSELFQEPEEIRNAVYEIMQIPESERSAVMDYVSYDSKDKRLNVQFPNGKTVVYLDVDPSIANAIRESKGVPKTSGETKTGEKWVAGIPDSRGAEFISRIKADPKYSKENEGKTWYYLEEIYDKHGKIRLKPKKKR